MRITGLVAPLQTLLLASLPKAAAFKVVEPPTQNAGPVAPLAQPVSIEMLVTLAATQSPVDRRRRAANHADRGLRALERLDVERVTRLPEVERLQEMTAWAETVEVPEDPELAALMQEIELRVRVELAKHDIVA